MNDIQTMFTNPQPEPLREFQPMATLLVAEDLEGTLHIYLWPLVGGGAV